jgi:hypothetical protein
MGDEPSNSNVPFLLNDAIWKYVNELVCTSGIEEETTHNQIELYPNPAKENITISTRGDALGRMVVYNQLGAKILEYNSDQDSLTIDLSLLKEGIYFLALPRFGRTMRFMKK